MSDPVPGGEEEKIIINAGIAARVLDAVCERLYDRFEKGWEAPDIKKMVVLANELEDKAFAFEREFLDQAGFKGPYSHAIDIKK